MNENRRRCESVRVVRIWSVESRYIRERDEGVYIFRGKL